VVTGVCDGRGTHQTKKVRYRTVEQPHPIWVWLFCVWNVSVKMYPLGENKLEIYTKVWMIILVV